MCCASTKGILAIAAEAALRALLLLDVEPLIESGSANQARPDLCCFTPSLSAWFVMWRFVCSTDADWNDLPLPSNRKLGSFECSPRFLLSAIANHEPGGCAVPSGLNFCAFRVIGISAGTS